MTDDLDRPEPDGYSLVMPFVVTESAGGPYADDPFVAGYQAGLADKALEVAAAIGAETVALPFVLTTLVPQVELIAMRHGFPHIDAISTEATPEWAAVTVSKTAKDTP